MTYFGTTRDKESHDHDVGEKAKSHPVRLTGAFWRVKEKLGRREIADHRPGIRLTSSLAASPLRFLLQSPTLRRAVRPVARDRACAGIVHRTQDRRNRFSYELSLFTRNILQAGLRPRRNFPPEIPFEAGGAIYGVSTIASPHLFPREIARQGLVCKIKLRV